MPDDAHLICFQCGHSAAESQHFNRLENGDLCPVCADRLLATLPPILPNFAAVPESEDVAEESSDLAPRFDDDDQPA